ncbi:MAG: cation:proton antiporter [Gammaproteobacteria bacterium]|jgi:Kef-type K+ transport system membrane component KefB|nr:cation:proton antiporter [Gammaproteobacteria bacterium]MBU2222831.1 cation:proton antiporter [Gammaproteobacteria bacterium]MBU2277594.1 cation:proton antiporter [Gammaproteobacteria bacterium]MBU2426780.1 cation:proton antiporter [Gammaproteobacteria bacterium]
MNFLPQQALVMSPLLSFGVLLVVGALGGYLAHRWSWLPSITGFMLVGLLVGPSGLGLLDYDTLKEARILVDIALALILYRLGSSLDLRFIRRSPRIVFVAAIESAATFCAVFALCYFLGFSALIAAVIGAILISSSPAVLLHVAHEVGAKGPVTESAKTLVALNNLMSFLVFALVIPALLLHENASWQEVVLHPLYLLLGSGFLGLVIGLGLHFVISRTAKAGQYKLAMVVGALMFTLGLAQQLQLSMLFAPLIVGIVVRSVERDVVVSAMEFGSAFELFFIVLFVFAGASLHLAELIQYGPVILALVLTRSLVKLAAVSVSLRFALQPWRQSSATGLLLIPMAGLAIGLVQTASQLVPEQATVIAAVVLGAVTLFETLGPPMAAFAFGLAGEAAASTPVRKQSPWRLKHEVQVDVSALVVQKPEDVEVTEEATETVKRRFRLWPFAGKA